VRADCGSARRARPAERAPVDEQRQLSGAWRSERLREHARGEPTRSGRVHGGEGRLARGRRVGGARLACVEPKRRGTTRPLAGVAASHRCNWREVSIVAVESSAEAACWARRRQQQRRAAEAGRLRKASRVQHTKQSDRLRLGLGFSGYRA